MHGNACYGRAGVLPPNGCTENSANAPEIKVTLEGLKLINWKESLGQFLGKLRLPSLYS